MMSMEAVAYVLGYPNWNFWTLERLEKSSLSSFLPMPGCTTILYDTSAVNKSLRQLSHLSFVGSVDSGM
jgi:hypothetical protein